MLGSGRTRRAAKPTSVITLSSAPVPPAGAPDGLEPLAQLVDLVRPASQASPGIYVEQQIRNGRITVYGIRSPIDLLSDLYQPLLSEEWAGLVIDWWNGCAYPAEHHGPTARTASTWLHLHIDRCDVPEPESLIPTPATTSFSCSAPPASSPFSSAGGRWCRSTGSGSWSSIPAYPTQARSWPRCVERSGTARAADMDTRGRPPAQERVG